ncbi:armadillo repeat-containing protein 7 isoform X1 [Lucilia cuprina]|uniref:armadillo repeat-containing protein 7 isoform X1 n=1 Tax=Lucilia cuprina TaxID=7375 RepID=UPI001F06D771|nr:armadillo repeat-containing protein 7 isoform X1 [Lucilia cuprina]
MFSSHNYLKRKTPEQGINRQEYIEHLVEEYYTTTNVGKLKTHQNNEAQEQVSANLANFAYDPINWDYLKTAEVLKLFFELLELPNEKLQLHGSAGLCNICLDKQALKYIIKADNFYKLKNLLLKTTNLNIVLNSLTLLYQLLSNLPPTKNCILCATILKKIQHFKTVYEKDQRIVNICNLIIAEFGQRHEFIEVNTQLPTNDQRVE